MFFPLCPSLCLYFHVSFLSHRSLSCFRSASFSLALCSKWDVLIFVTPPSLPLFLAPLSDPPRSANCYNSIVPSLPVGGDGINKAGFEIDFLSAPFWISLQRGFSCWHYSGSVHAGCSANSPSTAVVSCALFKDWLLSSMSEVMGSSRT